MAASGALRKAHFPLDNYELDDRFRRESGRVFLTGTQALVRIPLMQRTMGFSKKAISSFSPPLTRNSLRPPYSAHSRLKPIPTSRWMAFSASGTAKAPVSIAPAMA